MRRPHDLAAFVSQEERVHIVDELKAELASQQDLVDSADNKDDGIVSRIYKSLHITPVTSCHHRLFQSLTRL